LLSNEPQTITYILRILRSQNAEYEMNAQLSIQQKFFEKDSHGRNFLHMACRKLRPEEDNKIPDTTELINTVFSILDEEKAFLKEKALTEVTPSGCTPLHYLCRSGKIENFDFLDNVQSPTLYHVFSTKSRRGFTPLHYVCQYGNLQVFKNILKKLDKDRPGASYYFLKKHEDEFRNLIKQNKNKSKFKVQEFDNYLQTFQLNNKALYNLVEMYRYLEQRSDNSEDYKDRRDDFLVQLTASIQQLQENRRDTPLFNANTKFMIETYCCFFQPFRSQRYYNHMAQLNETNGQMTLTTLSQFKAFLELQKTNPLTQQLLFLASLTNVPSYRAQAGAPVFPQPSAPLLPPSDANPPPYEEPRSHANCQLD
jgi:hypothetical protein